MKLYTKTVCPKCMLVKSELNRLGLEAEIVNIDHDEEARNTIIDAGLLTVPVLGVNGELIGEVSKILAYIESIGE